MPFNVSEKHYTTSFFHVMTVVVKAAVTLLSESCQMGKSKWKYQLLLGVTVKAYFWSAVRPVAQISEHPNGLWEWIHLWFRNSRSLTQQNPIKCEIRDSSAEKLQGML